MCTYSSPSQRTRRSKAVQKRSKALEQASQIALPSSSLIINTGNQAPDQSLPSQVLTPVLPSPLAGTPFQSGDDGSFLDAFLGDGTLGLGQEPSFWSQDLQVEGAAFFPLDHYECLNEFLGTGSSVSNSGKFVTFLGLFELFY
jgi:hypothetical protein